MSNGGASRRTALTVTLLILTAIAVSYIAGLLLRPSALLRITFLDVGQGDSAVIETPDGRTMVLDTGRSSEVSSRGRSTVLPFLRTRGVNTVNALVLTHWDSDHAGGAPALLSDIRVRHLIVQPEGPWTRQPSPTESEVRAAAARKRLKCLAPYEGQSIRLGSHVELKVLNPPKPQDRFAPRTDNDASLVMLLRYGKARVMFTADAGAEAEHRIVRARADVRADILKVAHHGSASGTSDRWLDAVRPKVAIISVGRNNPFGHPDARVLTRLKRRGVRILRTDEDGAVTVVSDGTEYRMRRYRRGNN